LGEPDEKGRLKVGPDFYQPLDPPHVDGLPPCVQDEVVWVDEDSDSLAAEVPTTVSQLSPSKPQNMAFLSSQPRAKRNAARKKHLPRHSIRQNQSGSLKQIDEALSPLFALWQRGVEADNQAQVASARCGLTSSVAKSWPHLNPNQVAKAVNQAARRIDLRHPWTPVKPEVLEGRIQIGPLSKAAIRRLRSAKVQSP